jgi:hypothetical protein
MSHVHPGDCFVETGLLLRKKIDTILRLALKTTGCCGQRWPTKVNAMASLIDVDKPEIRC